MPNENKPNFYISAIKLFFIILFPSFLIFRIQRQVSKAAWVGDPWFKKQSQKSIKLFFLLLIPSLISLAGIAFSAKMSFPGTLAKLERAHELYKKSQYKKAKDQLSFGAELENAKNFFLYSGLSLLPSFFAFALIQTSSSLLRNQRLLQKVLKDQRFWGEQKPRLAVFTPVGVLIDVTGHAPKDLAYQDAIWNSLNMTIDKNDFLDQPDQRSLVFFRPVFTLKDKYEF